MATRKGADHYPRPGDRLAPSTLREVLMEPAPTRLVPAAADGGVRLCDLDEAAWEELPAAAIEELSELIVDRVAAGCSRKLLLSMMQAKTKRRSCGCLMLRSRRWLIMHLGHLQSPTCAIWWR